MMRQGTVAALLLTAVPTLGLTACGSTDRKAGRPSTSAPAITQTVSPTKALTTVPSEYPLGTELTLEPAGRTVVALGYEKWTSTSRFTQPKEGFYFATVDVKGCAGPAPDRYRFLTFDFKLAMPDARRIAPLDVTPGNREPRLSYDSLSSADCIRGWITYEVPEGQSPSFVVYSPGDVSAKWRVG